VISELGRIEAAVLESERAPLESAADRVLALHREVAGDRRMGGVANIVTDHAANKTEFAFRAPPDAVMRFLGRDASIIGRPVG
jgi:hypothetical protein